MRLPALPEVLLKLLELYRREDASIAEFAALIAADPAMAAKVLTVANSAAYQRNGSNRDLSRCLSVLGTDTVRTIVINQAIFQSMYSLPVLRHADLGPFWRHSLLAASVAREVARQRGDIPVDEAYLAGLLHDIGRLALLAAAPEFYAEGLPVDDDPAQCVAERRWLKVDHAEAGGWLIDRWRLGRALADGVRYHHEPSPRLVGAEPLICIVALAHLVAEDSPDPKLVGEAAELCGLDLAQVTAIAARANSTLDRTAEQLGIDLDAGGATSRSSSAAEQLEVEVETLMVATTVLSNMSVPDDESRYALGLGDAARLVFQFRDVVAMAVDGEDRLRRIGEGQSLRDSPDLGWRDFSLPCGAATRIGDAMARRVPLFIDREKDAAEILSVAEDQLLRLLSTEQLVVLPARIGVGQGLREIGALVCTGDPALLADLASRQSFLSAFVARAEATRARARQQRSEAQIRHDRMAESQIGSTRDLVHEINNPLAIVQNYLGLLDTKLCTSDALGEVERRDLSGDIAVLQQEVARVGRLVSALATSPPATASGSVEVNQLIADVVRLFRADARAAGIDISASGNDSTDSAVFDRDTLEQVLVNLVKNSIEAMSSPAARAAAKPEGARIIVANGGLVNRDGKLSLEINVRDNGPGMPGTTLQRLFSGSPAQQELAGAAEKAANGTARGRGLTIVHQLVEAMGGAIVCRSSGSGTSFEILLPFSPILPPEPESEPK